MDIEGGQGGQHAKIWLNAIDSVAAPADFTGAAGSFHA